MDENYKKNVVLVGKEFNGIELGKDFYLDFNQVKNLLVSGCTAAGKSIFLHVLYDQISEQNKEAEFYLFDPKRIEFGKESKKGNATWVRTPEDVEKAFAELKVKLDSLDHDLYLIVDELACYMGELDEEFIGLIQKKNPFFHFIVSSQAFSMRKLRKLPPYIPNRMAFVESSVADSKFIIGRSGCELLKGCGDGLAIINGETTRVQIIWKHLKGHE